MTPDDPAIAPYQTYQIPTVQSASISGSREQEGDGTPPTGIDESVASKERLLSMVEEHSARRSFSTNSSNSTPPTALPVMEASGWKYGAHGEVILVAQAGNVAPRSSGPKLPSCKD
mgnify:CR=1 FL=1